MNILRFTLVLVIVALFSASNPSAFAADHPPPQSIRVVMDNNYPPYVFLDSSGTLQGILVDQWRLWEQKTGVKVEIHALDWDEALRRMQEGEYDVIDTIFRTEARSRFVTYLPPYQKIEVLIFFDREISAITDASSLKGFAVGVKAGDASVDFLRKHGVDTFVTYHSYESIVQAAAEHRIPVFVMDAPPAHYFLHKSGIQSRFRHSEPLYAGEFHRAVRKDDSAMADLVQSGFSRITPQEYQEIDQRWYGKAAWEAYPLRWMLTIAAAILALVAVLVIWNYSLRRAVVRQTAALRQSEERYRAVVEALPDILFRIGRDGTFLDCHVADASVLLMPPAEFLGKKISDIMPPDLSEITELHLKNAVETGAIQRYEYSMVIREVLHHYEARMVPGGTDEVLTIVRDVTDQKRAEDELISKTTELDRFFSLSLDLLCIADLEGRFLRLNPEWESTLGYALGDMMGTKFIDYVHPDDRASTLQAVAELSRQRPVLNFANRYRCKDGSFRWIEWRSHASDGLIYAAARDITARKRSEAALRDSEDKYRQLFEAESDAVFLIDNETGRILEANGAAEALYGYSREEMLTKRNADLSAQPEETEQVTSATPLNAERVVTLPLRMHRRKDGTVFPVEITGRFFSLNGKPVHIAAVRNISERKRLEEQLLQSQKMEAVGILAGGVAHDFNNILQAIISSAHLLKLRHKEVADVQHVAADILTLSDRAADLTRGLLAFSRKQVMSTSVVDLNEVIVSTTRMFQRLLGEDIVLKLKVSETGMHINADRAQIQQVLLNLMNNARDAMPTGGTLSIKSFRDEYAITDESGNTVTSPCAVLEVRDTGKGIGADDLRHIFEPFYTTKEVGKGTGLGLSVVYGIVRQHKGTVDVSSMPDKGTVFRVALPLAQELREDLARVDWSSTGSRGETLLLVEDDENVRTSTVRLLSAFGYKVVSASGGDEAIAFIRQHPETVSLALIDVIMPGMNGAEVYKTLHAISPKLKVIFLSGYPQDILQDRQLGDIPYIAKPIMPKELFARIEEILAAGGS